MKTFKFHFLDGSIAFGKGENVAKAFTNAGFSAGAIRVLNYYEEV